MDNPDQTLHPFERRGLGKAPFKFTGMDQQDQAYGQVCLNRDEFSKTGILLSTKPCGTCAYCGTAIINLYNIVSSDGKRFHVGCDCVELTADRKLIAVVKKAKAAHDKTRRTAKKAATDAANRAAISSALANPSIRSKLRETPSQHEWKRVQGGTLLEDFEWLAEHCGATGRGRAAGCLPYSVSDAYTVPTNMKFNF